MNKNRLENHKWQTKLNEALIYQVVFEDEVAFFQLNEENFLEKAQQNLKPTSLEVSDLLTEHKEQLNFTARYHIEGNHINLIQSIHTAKQYEISFEGPKVTLISADGSEIVLERVKR
ncbi:hypothetical protein [Facklamia miroungae]|uniref:Uncharacterized protein n=1 Tax=Facklamia miroungae TaxID=120956 RepID=A0A1G7USL4_9LACT|nr:hypothetical protein [Facklamia miroungae]NKZ30163.1 hypothetical protein [Facklamia miroungae]SDG49730.1 hypothetical protein SAMN05421791_11136 [Facklamia miroungae]